MSTTATSTTTTTTSTTTTSTLGVERLFYSTKIVSVGKERKKVEMLPLFATVSTIGR